MLERAGYPIWAAHTRGRCTTTTRRSSAGSTPTCGSPRSTRELALIYPPWCDYETIRYLRSIGYTLIEVPPDEQQSRWPVNMHTIEPRKVIMNEGSPRTRALLEKPGVETIEIQYDEVQRYGGGIRCTTMQLVRDPGPKVFG